MSVWLVETVPRCGRSSAANSIVFGPLELSQETFAFAERDLEFAFSCCQIEWFKTPDVTNDVVCTVVFAESVVFWSQIRPFAFCTLQYGFAGDAQKFDF